MRKYIMYTYLNNKVFGLSFDLKSIGIYTFYLVYLILYFILIYNMYVIKNTYMLYLYNIYICIDKLIEIRQRVQLNS